MKKVNAYYRGYEIFWVEYDDAGWCEILFYMPPFESPITGTGRYRVWPEDIELKVVEE